MGQGVTKLAAALTGASPSKNPGFVAFPNWTGLRNPNTRYPVAPTPTAAAANANLTGASNIVAAAEQDEIELEERGVRLEVMLPKTAPLDFRVIGIALPRY